VLKKSTALLIFIMYLGLITYLSLTTIKVAKVNVSNADKMVHICIYAVFVILLYIPLVKYKISNSIFKAFIAAVIYGIIIEILQDNFTVNRQFDIYDIIANTLGSCLTVVFLIIKGEAIVKIK